jgi:hypothetical protein
MANINDWRAIYRSSDPDRVRKLITSLAAMEFDVRCSNGAGSPLQSQDEQFGPPPYVVEVPQEHWPELAEVVDEIISEQDEFDAMLDAREHMSHRKRRMLILLIIIVAALATLGLIEL